MNGPTVPNRGGYISSSVDVDQPYLPGMEQYMHDHLDRLQREDESKGPPARLTLESETSNIKSIETKINA